LLPIVAAAAASSCPSLAALPESCKPEQPFALTRLIGSQDEENVVLVAEDQGKLVRGYAAQHRQRILDDMMLKVHVWQQLL
jgi:hypothetical protein